MAGYLMSLGHIVFSPISHTHPIAVECDLPKDWEYWKKYDECFIEWCDQVHVWCMDGWKESRGVQAEINMAKKFGKEIVCWQANHYSISLPSLIFSKQYLECFKLDNY